MGWGAGGSVEAPAGPIAMCDSAHGDGAFGDGSICSGAEEQGLGQLDRRSRSLRHSGSAEGGWGGAYGARWGRGGEGTEGLRGADPAEAAGLASPPLGDT